MSVNTITTRLVVRARVCPLCEAPVGYPCQPKPAGDHLARYLDARTAGHLTREYMNAVLGELVVIDACAVITVPSQPLGGACHYCGRDGQRLAPCCDRPEHEHQLACADVEGCRDYLLEQIEAYQEAEYMAEPEGYCVTCGENVAHFFGYEGPQHFRGPHKLVTGAEHRELFDADHAPVIAWREAVPPAGTVLLAELRDRMGVGEPADRPGDEFGPVQEPENVPAACSLHGGTAEPAACWECLSVIGSPVGRLVIRDHDDSPCPVVGRVVGQVDEDTLEVLWGERQFEESPGPGSYEPFDSLRPAPKAAGR